MFSARTGLATGWITPGIVAFISVSALLGGFTWAQQAHAADSYTISASASAGGVISPSGSVVVASTTDQTFTITPDSGYQVADVVVDTVSVGAVSSHTFTAVSADHSITASFATIPNSSIYISPSGSDTTGDGSLSAPFATIAHALDTVVAGGTVHVASGTYVLSGPITMSKAGVTLEGAGTPILQISGATTGFMISATGVTIKGFKIEKTDKTTQGIIQIAASNVSVINNEVSGQFVIGDAEVSRALVIQGGLSGLQITGNSFHDLRQPAYISGVTTGTVSGNYTARTKGWVIEQGDLTFTNNTWGQGANANVFDIAVLATAGSTYYTDIAVLSAANNGAFIENQRTTPATLSIVYVDGTVMVSGDGTARSPVKTLSDAVTRVVTGGTIVLASDITTVTQVNIGKSLTLDGAGHKVTAAFNGGSVIQITANNVTIKNLVEDGGTASAVPTTGNRGINVYVATGVLLDSVTVSNNSKNGLVVNGSTVTVNNITTSGNGWEAIDVDLGGGVTSPASLTVNGVSVHSETKAGIRIDDITKATSVTDTNSQYTATTTGNTRDFYLNQKKIKTTSVTQQTTTSEGGSVSVEIPSGTVVTANEGWDGIIAAPAATSVSIVVDGFNSTMTSAIAVGSSLYDLTFDKAVKLTFAGQAGKHIGWFNHSGTFTEITTACADNTQVTNDNLAAGTDCTITVGGDLVVWTKHFSTFATYTQTKVSTGGSGGGSSSSVAVTTGSVAATPVTGQVLGAATYNFATNLTVGSRGDDVTALQEQLTQEGVYTGPITGYFGPLTREAVKVYQAKHGIITTGFVGPLTRAALNAGVTPTLSDEARAVLQVKIVELLKQLLDLQQKLNTELSK
ncbi:MAG: peptidoglycan-binding protein [Candidatus Pacebacteria bacterium]|nr:peptidoglycan-binding protein [Candidatus Paceibacterota bacterium]